MVVVRIPISSFHPRPNGDVPRRCIIRVILQRIGPIDSVHRHRTRQPIQCVISEGLSLRIAPRQIQVVLDRQHIPIGIIRIRQILQVCGALLARDIGKPALPVLVCPVVVGIMVVDK